MIWLDVDTLIRERTGDKKSLDDFAKAFFGINDGSCGADDLHLRRRRRGAERASQPYDWAGFLRTRLEGHGPGAPLDGLARGGYRLVFGDEPNEYQRAFETRGKRHDFTFSLGLSLGDDGQLASVAWNGPAFKAGLTVGDYLVAVNGEAFTPKHLRDAIAAAKTEQKPIELLLKNGSRYRTVPVDYQGGLRFPKLQRIDGVPARLDAILESRS